MACAAGSPVQEPNIIPRLVWVGALCTSGVLRWAALALAFGSPPLGLKAALA
jgi:hypothetical protein